jgi:hypothetical protein
MPREPKPWFNRQTGWWSTDLAGARYKLVRGKPGDERRKTPTKEATEALAALLAQCALNPPVESGPAVMGQRAPDLLREAVAPESLRHPLSRQARRRADPLRPGALASRAPAVAER